MAIQAYTYARQLDAFEPKFAQVVDFLGRAIPRATAFVLFGSQIDGTVDSYSDYDILVVAPSEYVPDLDTRAQLEDELSAQLGAPVQLAATSSQGAWLALRLAPYLRHWLERGIVVGDDSALRKPWPPLAREGARAELGSIEVDLEQLNDEPRDDFDTVATIFSAVKRLLLLQSAITGIYDVSMQDALTESLGHALVEELRSTDIKVGAPALTTLLARLQNLLAEVSGLVDSMPENLSDQELKQRVAIYQPVPI